MLPQTLPRRVSQSSPDIEKLGLPVFEGRGQVNDDPSLLVLGHKLVVIVFLGLLQTVQIGEFVHLNHISLCGLQPNFHIANYNPLRVGHKLPKSNIEVI